MCMELICSKGCPRVYVFFGVCAQWVYVLGISVQAIHVRVGFPLSPPRFDPFDSLNNQKTVDFGEKAYFCCHTYPEVFFAVHLMAESRALLPHPRCPECHAIPPLSRQSWGPGWLL